MKRVTFSSARWAAGVIVSGATLLSCGGTVVVDGEGGGGASATTGAGATGGTSSSGAAGPGGSTTSTGGTSTSVTTGPGPCTTHDDCGGGARCLFGTGVCAPACEGFACDDCGAGAVCDPCATSSCPACDDCLGACVPTPPDRCDDNDPCPPGEVCDFSTGQCEVPCGPNDSCPPGLGCVPCETGSCCGCENCVNVCLPILG